MKKMISFILLLTFLAASPVQMAAADESSREEPKVLILYHAEEQTQKEEVPILDMLVGHFSSDITIQSIEDAAAEYVKGDYTHVIYFGLGKRQLTEEELFVVDQYDDVKKMFIGNYFEYFKEAPDLRINDYRTIDGVIGDGKVFDLKEEKDMLLIDGIEQMEVLYEGQASDGSYPLVFKNDNLYYVAANSITGRLSDIIGESLFDFFNEEKSQPKKLIRLEDIHPKSDPVLVKQIGDYLAERNIPYAVTVIPVYTNPETGQQIYLSQAIELVEVLKEMQNNGASIIQHGYLHQYREDETGEGFEYWDVENDRPIYQSKEDEVKLREDFASDEEYQDFIQNVGLPYEQTHIYDSVVNGVYEMTAEGLYPIAFEAPHYSMSQTGYKELAKYFTTYVGQIQISDRTYDGTFSPLYVSTPAGLRGMKVIPETLGYVNPKKSRSIDRMIHKADYVSQFSDSYLAFFYHPYLGIDKFDELMTKLEKYDQYEWVDLKEMDHKTEVDGMVVETGEDDINVSRPMSVLVEQTTRDLWWVSLPLVIFVIIAITAVARKFRRRKTDSEFWEKQ
ncbi:polysaccharide deacetylase family protein [Planococcus sp. CP5-4]|uniref:polysaccharide deacetylase family protein n=1 Tax=unclassified Planococcus (in: firmicutes) TaxID=2662419 RepID=UPI001C236A26|nr:MULTISPECIES: polysaccharide deacetylase family protein [unclassified Planococcus (in: firmicutes)]MBU9673691.1 polysaccharide deacetylase family protein [Planococcus sp. CP5-4_YE]MBV0907981.1 polysaccharide deacetylase family protein [Planococcus sp. CP5-4_UN]MBW6063148.1 polysaccharide deacetylase family protein [Planococcus sp. CP5-4]